MKKLVLLICLVGSFSFLRGQTIVYQEGFEGATPSVTGSGSQPWATSTKLYFSGAKSDTCRIAAANDTSRLITSAFATTGNTYVILEFAHICKTEFFDGGYIEVSANNGSTWTRLLAANYLGAGQFGTNGNKFTATSYTAWLPSNGGAKPDNSWWKSEKFDISAIAANASQVKVRFTLFDGNGTGALGNYGWVIDDIKVTAAASELISPTISYNTPYIQDTVFTHGPYQISATIADASGVKSANLVYKVNNGADNTIAMTYHPGSIWTAEIPSMPFETRIDYHITAIDSTVSANSATSTAKWFYVKEGPLEVIIGTATTTSPALPIDPYYGYSYSQTIFKSQFITNTGNITKVAYQYKGGTVFTDNIKIYMGLTSKTQFASTTDWEPLNNLTLVYDGPITTTATSTWIELPLSTPFNYTGSSNLIIAVDENTSGYHSSTDDFYVSQLDADNKSIYYGNDSNNPDPASPPTGTLTALSPNTKLVFTVPDSLDLAITSMLTPLNSECVGSTEQVQIKINNTGLNAWDFAANPVQIHALSTGTNPMTFPIVTINTNTLAVGGNQTINIDNAFNMSAYGNYTFKFYIVSTADENSLNDTLVPSVITKTSPALLPQLVSFTGFTGANLATTNTGWREATGTMPLGTTSSWASSSNLGSTGNVTASINLYSNTKKAWIVSPKFTVYTGTSLKYDVAVTDYSTFTTAATMGSDDSVSVMISSDCGVSWQKITKYSVTSNLSTSLTTFEHSLAAYSGSDVMIAFYATEGSVDDLNDYLFHIDNINIYNVFNNDAKLVSISNPQGACGMGLESIKVQIKNSGSQLINGGLTANYKVNNNPTVSEAVSTQITAGNTIDYTFSQTFDFTAINQDTIFNIKAWTSLTADQYLLNDTVSQTIESKKSPNAPIVTSPVSIPYGTSTTLSASSTDSIFWYDASTNGNLLQQGSSFTTPIIYGNTSYWVEAANGGFEGATIGTGTSTQSNLPFNGSYDYSWSGMIYNAYEIATKGKIDTIAFNISGASNYTILNQSIYIGHTTDTAFADASKPNPATMSLVYQGDITFDGDGWFKIPLTNSFDYNGTSNLIVYWENHDGSYDFDYPSISYSTTTVYKAKYDYDDTSFPTIDGTRTMNRPNIKLLGSGKGCSSSRVQLTVNVTGIPANDASAVAIVTPVSAIDLTNAEIIKVTLKNYGTSPISNFGVSYKINNNTVVTENCAQVINSGASYDFSFATTANLSAYTTFNIKSWVSLTGDATSSNDTTSSVVINSPVSFCTSGSTYTTYGDIGNVSISNLNNGTGTPTLSNASALNTYSDFTNLPAIQLVQGNTYPMSISQITPGTTLYASLANAYIDYNYNGVFDANEIVFSKSTSTTATTVYDTLTVPTNAVTNKYLRMRVVIDESDVAPACGAYSYGETEDYNVFISPQLQYDAGVTAITKPAATQNQGDVVPVKVVIKNFGTDPLNTVTVYYKLNNQAALSQTWNGNLLPAASDTVTFANITIASGTSYFTAYTVRTGDTNFGNDTLKKIVYAQPANDAQAFEIVSPKSYDVAGALKDVSIVIKNKGTSTLTSVPVAYSLNGGTPVLGTFTGSILPNAVDTFTFTNKITVPTGLYNLCVYTSLLNDGDKFNDTICSELRGVEVISLSYQDDFEGQSNFFTVGSSKWELGTPQGTVINSAYSPSKSWVTDLDANYTSNCTEYLYTPYFNFQGITNATLSFYQWIQSESSSDGGKIEYTINNGQTWLALGTVGAANSTNWYDGNIGGSGAWYGLNTAWEQSSIQLTALNNQTNPVQFRFKFTSNGSVNYNGWAIDNFAITKVSIPQDAGVVSITQPSTATQTSSDVTVQVLASNYGTAQITSMNIGYSVNGGTAVVEQWTPASPIQPGAQASYTFTNKFVSPASTYELCAFTKLTSDTYTTNDTACASFNTTAAANDASVTAIITPAATTNTNTATNPVITIKNVGSNTITAMQVAYMVNYGTPKIENWTGSLATGQSINHTFSQSFITPISQFSFCAYTLLANDNYGLNDTLCSSIMTGIENIANNSFVLGQNMPNPSNGITTISLIVPEDGKYKFNIVNMLGQNVCSTENKANAGENNITLNISDWKAGIYYYSAEFNGSKQTRKMIIVK
ncbi:MAG: GEVED domain-containing protein [Bacteroidota bacterium]